MPTKWDFTEYHAKPKRWLDPAELKKKEKEKKEAERIKLEEQKKKDQLDLEKELLAEKNRALKDWDNLLGWDSKS